MYNLNNIENYITNYITNDDNFKHLDEKYKNVGWREYYFMDMGEQFAYTGWVYNMEQRGLLDSREKFEEVLCKTEPIKYMLIRDSDGEVKYFRSREEAGEFLGLSPFVVSRNNGKFLEGWIVNRVEKKAIVHSKTGVIKEVI